MGSAPSPEHNCAICAMEQLDEASVVFRDDLWAAEIPQGAEVPGWLFLRARRHTERITGLNDAESDSFGRRARDLAAALADVTDAPTTYLMSFGENHAHFHALVVPRGSEVPPDRRSGDILKLRRDHVDPVRAASLVPALREAYRHRASPVPA